MDALVIYPENKRQLVAVKAVLKSMAIPFEQRTNVYPERITQGLQESIQQADQGQLTPYTGIRAMLNSK